MKLPWDTDAFTAQPTRQWIVLRTRSRQEKAVAQTLAARGIAYFLPLIEQIRQQGKRLARVRIPLFPGYVFLYGQRDDAYEADRTRRIAQIIPVARQKHLQAELDSIRLALNNPGNLDPFPRLTAGVPVRVRVGPLKGVCGWIESRTKKDRLILKIEMLGQACSLEIDGQLLELLDESPAVVASGASAQVAMGDGI